MRTHIQQYEDLNVQMKGDMLSKDDTYVVVCDVRQHTSAYVSIRQHTSAYVSIRHAE
jgi:hypothetical protein